LKNKKPITTVIGSYPAEINTEEIIKSYYTQKLISWDKYIKSAVNDMLRAGIQMVSDGQTRDSFVNIFYRRISGCRIRERPEVFEKIRYRGPITIDDQKYVKSFLPKNTKLLGLITGPYTLSKSCVNLFYHNEKELAFDFADVLRQEAENLQKYVDMISIDEPFFSVSMPDYAKDLIQTITKNLKCPIRLHVCGDVSEIVSDILEIPVDVLSHEFKALPKLFDVFKEYNFKQNICLGSVRSDNPTLETVGEIVNHIKKGINVFNDKISQVSPDCGLRFLPRDTAYAKLRNLVKAWSIVYG